MYNIHCVYIYIHIYIYIYIYINICIFGYNHGLYKLYINIWIQR